MPHEKLEDKMPSLHHVRTGSEHRIAGRRFRVLEEATQNPPHHAAFLVESNQQKYWLHLPKPVATPDHKHSHTAYLETYQAPHILLGDRYEAMDQFQDITVHQQRWQIGNLIGEGSEARIFEVKNAESQKTYILKVFKPDRMLDDAEIHQYARDPQSSMRRALHARAEHEAAMLTQVGRETWRHHNSVLTEKMTGITYSRLVKHFRVMPLSMKLKVVQAVFDAVHACHQKGIAHRDLAPDNVMIEMTYQNQPCSPEMLRAGQVDFSQVTCQAHLIDFGQASAHLADRFETPTQLYHAHNTIHHVDAQQQVHVENIVEDVFQALKFLVGVGTVSDCRLHTSDDMTYHLSKLSGDHLEEKVSQPDVYLEAWRKLDITHSQLFQTFHRHYQHMLREAQLRHQQGTRLRPTALQHLIKPFCVLVHTLHTLVSVQEEMNGLGQRQSVWLRMGQNPSLKAAMRALYRRPSDTEAMAKAYQHLQQSRPHQQIRQQLRSFQKSFDTLQHKAKQGFHHLCMQSIRPIQWACAGVLGIMTTGIVLDVFAVQLAWMSGLHLWVANGVALPVMLTALVCLSLRWHAIAQHNTLHVHEQKHFQAANKMIAACRVEDEAKMTRPCSPRSPAETHFDAKVMSQGG